jgi:C4-dicarboxylate-specific signal transduction histidine kinase
VIAFRCEGENDVITITDPSRLQQVLDNVIENSVQQLTDRKTASPVITVECGQDLGKVWLEIRDNAGGFTKEGLQSALEPFSLQG